MLKGIQPLGRVESSRAEELARRIEALIEERGKDGEGRLGSKEELRQSFQVAHGTLNEAIRVLETRGLVELRRGPQGGVFVAQPSIYLRLSNVFLGLRHSPVSVEQCLAVRNQIEPVLICEATKVASGKPAELQDLYDILEKMYANVSDPKAQLKWNWALHRGIAKMGQNSVLTGIYLTLLDYIEAHVTEVAPTRSFGASQRVLDMHKEIVDAIASGDVSRATKAANNHPLPPDLGMHDVVPVPKAPRKKGKAHARG